MVETWGQGLLGRWPAWQWVVLSWENLWVVTTWRHLHVTMWTIQSYIHLFLLQLCGNINCNYSVSTIYYPNHPNPCVWLKIIYSNSHSHVWTFGQEGYLEELPEFSQCLNAKTIFKNTVIIFSGNKVVSLKAWK